jgi:Peptidase M50B-like
VSLGVVIVFVTLAGYVSNFLNWRYLNYKITRALYYVGAFVHETSHAILCVLTGAKIEEFTVFSDQPRVVHRKSKIPFLGELLISSAPIAGGLLFLFLVNRYLLGNYFTVSQSIFLEPFALLSQINLLQWQSWVMILLFFNVGAMLGPSLQDLKNAWPMLIILFFVRSPALVVIGLMALGLILVNIFLQVIAILLLKTLKA